MRKTYSLLFFQFLSGIATIAIMQNQGFFNDTLTNNCQYENFRGNSPHFFSWGNMMTQHPAVQRHFNTTTAQQRYAANFNAAFYPTPNIQIGPNYQGGAPAHFHAATYPTLNIQSGPNNQAEAPSNKHTDKPSTQLSFLVKFTPDQAETYFTRAKNMGLASACGHQLTQEIVQDVNSHIANGKKRNAQRFLRGNTTFASHGAGPCPSLPANQTCAILSAISANIYMY